MEPLIDNRSQAESDLSLRSQPQSLSKRQNKSHFQHHNQSNGPTKNDDQFQSRGFEEEGQTEENISSITYLVTKYLSI